MVERLHDDGSSSPLDPRLYLANKIPTGLAWGHGGSGPAQLALAILADHLHDDDRALRLYQDFKFSVTARLGEDAEWRLIRADVSAAVSAIDAERVLTDRPAAKGGGAAGHAAWVGRHRPPRVQGN